jgi:hypothetical protein
MIKLKCPDCNQDIEAPDEILNEESVSCPSCARDFKPVRRLPEGFWPDPPNTTPEQKARYEKRKPGAPVSAVDKIEGQATAFEVAAIAFAVIGIITLFLAIVSATQTDENGNAISHFMAWATTGSLFGLALWLYLIAQIIYIRALLAKGK